MNITTKIKIALAAAALIIICSQAIENQRLQNDRRQTAQELSALRRQAAGLSRELKLNFQAVRQREEERTRLLDENSTLTKELEAIYESDCQAGRWADVHCPDSVIKRLRR